MAKTEQTICKELETVGTDTTESVCQTEKHKNKATAKGKWRHKAMTQTKWNCIYCFQTETLHILDRKQTYKLTRTSRRNWQYIRTTYQQQPMVTVPMQATFMFQIASTQPIIYHNYEPLGEMPNNMSRNNLGKPHHMASDGSVQYQKRMHGYV